VPDPISPDDAAYRDLLLGILALQTGFISQDALGAALRGWGPERRQPLGQLLVEQGALSQDAYALLPPLVEKHLQSHGGAADKALAAVGAVSAVREALRQIPDPELQAHLATLTPAPKTDLDPHATLPPRAAPPAAGQRFRILRPHAKGGLGEVFVAHDGELHREVALKQIQTEHADHPDSRARFLMEAELTGGLEHPGIVPVYGLGVYPDGRPFYAMRFIKGDSLKEAIERFHKGDQRGSDPGQRALELRELLGGFLDVCNAIDYAHSRGVLHRDLNADFRGAL
jgi:serine/threonine-protein kinase